jgi:hypothetical protein
MRNSNYLVFRSEAKTGFRLNLPRFPRHFNYSDPNGTYLLRRTENSAQQLLQGPFSLWEKDRMRACFATLMPSPRPSPRGRGRKTVRTIWRSDQ